MAPTWLPKMQLRSHSIELLKILDPAPSGPNLLSAGTQQSCKTHLAHR